jgi:hypothetical protein
MMAVRLSAFAVFNGLSREERDAQELTSQELMNAVNPYCSKCGSPLESDCDFCPACGAAKSKISQALPTREAHSWMADPAAATTPINSGRLAQPSAPLQVQYVPYAVPAPVTQTQVVSEESGLPVAVRTLGIIALSFTLVALIPCLGWINYMNLFISPVTLVLAIVSIVTARTDSGRTAAILGLVLVLLANTIGVLRLILGGGCI